jgi:biotin operon repressor
MTGVRGRGEAVRKYIIENVEQFPKEITKKTAEKFGITRQAANKHMRRLTSEGFLIEEGATKSRVYKLAALSKWGHEYVTAHRFVSPPLTEHDVWRDDIAPRLGKLPDGVRNIWQHGFTEMFNNALDHSEGTWIRVEIIKTAAKTEIWIADNGVGIFRKIKKALNLVDERHAVLELGKGKFTTDPRNHSGEGIFFTSRMMDEYTILSGDVVYMHDFGDAEDYILQRSKEYRGPGTTIYMMLDNHTNRTTIKVFDMYSEGDAGFNKTVVPVALAEYGDDQLVSRSQAKRLLTRLDRFHFVILDFKGVPTVGQAFADEIFRVFANQHPEIGLSFDNANSAVKRMIDRAKAGQADEQAGANALLSIASHPEQPPVVQPDLPGIEPTSEEKPS